MSYLFIQNKRPNAENNIIQQFIVSFQQSQQFYKNKEYHKVLEELIISNKLLIDIWDEYPKIKTLYLMMKSFYHIKKYSQCLSIQTIILEKILIEEQRDKGICKEKNDFFIKVKAKIGAYHLIINFIYDNLDKSIQSIIDFIKDTSENEILSLDDKIKYFWNYIKTILKISGITKTNKFKLFKQAYDSMIIIEKKEYESINNCIYEPIKKIDRYMKDKYKIFMNLKLRTNLYEILDKEYYHINFGLTNDKIIKVMNFLQKNMHVYVRENNKIKLIELFHTFLDLGKINLKHIFNMTMNEIIHIQKRRIEKFDIIFANLVGAFTHIFKKYFTNENFISFTKPVDGKNIIRLNHSLKEINKQYKILKSFSPYDISETDRKQKLIIFGYNSNTNINIPSPFKDFSEKKRESKYGNNIFNKNIVKINNKKLKLIKDKRFLLNKKNIIFKKILRNNILKENITDFPIINNNQKIKNKNNILNFSDGEIKHNKNKENEYNIKSNTLSKNNDKKKAKKDNENNKENNSFILRNINNILITKLIDLFIPVYKIENNLVLEEYEMIKYKSNFPRKIDLYNFNIQKIVSSYYSISINGSNSSENKDAYFYYEDYMLIKNLILLGVCDGHGKFGYLISDKICTLFPAYLIYIIIEDNLIKNNKDINKEMYKLFKLKENPHEVKDMHLLHYFFNKFNINLKNDIPLLNENILLLKNQVQEAFYYSHNDLKHRYNIDYEFSGTTICSCFILGDYLYVINLGDSQIMVGTLSENNNNWDINPISIKHTLDIPEENMRIVLNGGRIGRIKDENNREVGPLRVYNKNIESDIPGLTISRSIGDNFAKKLGVSYEPDVTKYKLKKEDKIIIIGTDGLFKCLTNEEIINILGNFYIDNKSAEEAVISLIEIAKNRNKYNYKLKLAKKRKKIILNTENNIDSKQPVSDEEKEINKGNFDDITCIVVFL